MLVVESSVNSPDEIEATIYEASGLLDHMASFVEDRWACHPGRTCAEVFCLISPPGWLWWVGITARFSLGNALSRLGQYVCRRTAELPVVHTDLVSEEDAVAVFGWDASDLRDVLALRDDLDD